MIKGRLRRMTNDLIINVSPGGRLGEVHERVDTGPFVSVKTSLILWEILAEGMLGYVVLMDGSRRSTFEKVKGIVEAFTDMCSAVRGRTRRVGREGVYHYGNFARDARPVGRCGNCTPQPPGAHYVKGRRGQTGGLKEKKWSR